MEWSEKGKETNTHEHTHECIVGSKERQEKKI